MFFWVGWDYFIYFSSLESGWEGCFFYPSFRGKDLSKRLFLSWHARGEGWLFLRVEGLGFFLFSPPFLPLEFHDLGEIFSPKNIHDRKLNFIMEYYLLKYYEGKFFQM